MRPHRRIRELHRRQLEGWTDGSETMFGAFSWRRGYVGRFADVAGSLQFTVMKNVRLSKVVKLCDVS